MDERNPASVPREATTDVFKINATKTAAEPENRDPSLYTVDGRAHRGVSERTLKKRLAKLASSRAVLLLALLTSFSAVLTAFRGYLLPVTLFLVAVRVLEALGLWMLYVTAGKKGGRLLAALPLYSTVAAVAGLLVLAVYISAAMFGKVLLISTGASISLVRAIYSAKLWGVIPALICIMAAYCFYLFKRHERQLLCNVRDGLRYGFPYEQGYKAFARNCVIVAVLLIVLQTAMAFVASFSRFSFISDTAVEMLDRLFLRRLNYGISLAGVIVQAAVLILAAVLAYRYGSTVKKYKAQKSAANSAERSARESTEAVIEMENEKAAARAKNGKA